MDDDRNENYNCKKEKIFFELEIKAGEDKSCLKRLMNENLLMNDNRSTVRLDYTRK